MQLLHENNAAEVELTSTPATLCAIAKVDTWCNSANVRDIARNVASRVWSFTADISNSSPS